MYVYIIEWSSKRYWQERNIIILQIQWNLIKNKKLQKDNVCSLLLRITYVQSSTIDRAGDVDGGGLDNKEHFYEFEKDCMLLFCMFYYGWKTS